MEKQLQFWFCSQPGKGAGLAQRLLLYDFFGKVGMAVNFGTEAVPVAQIFGMLWPQGCVSVPWCIKQTQQWILSCI